MLENDRYDTYDVVPAGFDLLDAPRDRLDHYGIPSRPDKNDQPRLFEFWEKLVSPPFFARRPTFSSIESWKTLTKPSTARPSNPRSLQRTLSRGGNVEWKWTWSGAVVSPPWPKRFVFATAGWVAPNV